MIIAIANQKGGVGKSTTTLAIAAAFAASRKKVLIIDADAQGNTTTTLCADADSPTLYDVLTGAADIKDAIQTTADGALIASSRALAKMDIVLVDIGKEKTLKKAISGISAEYDFILIDTPPALGILTVNALTAADGLIIPACAEAFGLQGITQLGATLDAVREHTNKDLTVLGILLTRHRQLNLMRDMETLAEEVAASIGTSVYKTRIRETASLKEAQAMRQNIFKYNPKSIGAADYADFAEELAKQILKIRKGKR